MHYLGGKFNINLTKTKTRISFFSDLDIFSLFEILLFSSILLDKVFIMYKHTVIFEFLHLMLYVVLLFFDKLHDHYFLIVCGAQTHKQHTHTHKQQQHQIKYCFLSNIS